MTSSWGVELRSHPFAGRFELPAAGFGAGEGIRTLDINLGKVALYQLSYARVPCGGPLCRRVGERSTFF